MGLLGVGVATRNYGGINYPKRHVASFSYNINMENSNFIDKSTKVKRLPGVTWCSAVNCSNNKTKNKNLSFFGFPKDAERLVVKF